MPDTPCHIVNRTTFAVKLGRGVDAFKAQGQLEDFFHQRLTPALDQALGRYAPDTDYRIERLEIDLGAIDIHRPDRGLADKIRAAVYAALKRIDAPAILVRRPEVRLQRSLIAFLESGQIPWDTPVDTLASLEKDIQALKPEARVPLIAVIHPLLGRPTIRRRLLAQFRGSFVQWLLETIQPALPEAFASAAPRRYLDVSPPDRLAIQLKAAASVPPGSAAQELVEALRLLLRASQPEIRKSSTDAEVSTGRKADTTAPVEEGFAAVAAQDQLVFVSQAGVVLLHPFLPRFFDRCGLLTTAQRFRHRRDRELAVHLLHFLSTGQEHPEEPQTTVYKVLCGLDIHEPVIRVMDLAAAHREEANDLLRSAITHWRRLKNTSPDGLRSSFLQRQGKLRRIDDGWHLTVEQQSIDILLGTLPWSLGDIRLPWLRQPIRVDWA